MKTLFAACMLLALSFTAVAGPSFPDDQTRTKAREMTRTLAEQLQLNEQQIIRITRLTEVYLQEQKESKGNQEAARQHFQTGLKSVLSGSQYEVAAAAIR